MLIAETQYSINFTISRIKFLLSLHYNESNRMLFVNATKKNQLKVKYSEIKKIFLVFRKYVRRIFQLIT